MKAENSRSFVSDESETKKAKKRSLTIDIGALATAEKREKRLEDLITALKDRKGELKKQASDHKTSFKNLVKELEGLLNDKAKMLGDDNDAHTNYIDIYTVDDQVERVSAALSDEVYAYSQTLSMLSEVNRQIGCFTKEKDNVVKGDKFKKNPTGTVEGLIGVDLPDDQINAVVEGVKAKVNVDGITSKLGGLFGKEIDLKSAKRTCRSAGPFCMGLLFYSSSSFPVK